MACEEQKTKSAARDQIECRVFLSFARHDVIGDVLQYRSTKKNDT